MFQQDLITPKNPEAIRALSKLLQAAQRAQSQGKYLALSKIISEARKLSDRMDHDTREQEHEEANLNSKNLYADLFKTIRKHDDNYRKVSGEIVE